MSYQQPGPPQPYNQQPYQGQPYGQPFAGGPAPYQPPPPKKGMSAGAIVAITLGGVVAFFILIGVIASGGDDSTQADDKPTAKSSAPAKAAPEKEDDAPAEPAAADSPVKVTAKKTAFKPSILHDGGAYTSVLVTIANNGDEQISVNPLYFAITDTDGTKHPAELAVDENQIDTVKLAPGENVSGVITGKGGFSPQYVTYTDGFLGDSVRADVS